MNQKKLLFTPGPLNTSETVKQSMLRDLGSRDAEFLSVVSHIRHRLLELGRVTDGSYEAVLMQGSGTFAIESVLSSVIPCNGKLLVAINGAYGHRMATIARVLGTVCQTIVFDEDTPVQAGRVYTALSADPTITHVGAIHCETSTGILNPTNELGHAVRELQRTFIVDGMSSFGGIPMDLSAAKIDFLISSANKCIQGVPGFAFILARRDLLQAAEGCARSVSLDLQAQWRGFESDGQFPLYTSHTRASCLLAGSQGVGGRRWRCGASCAIFCQSAGAYGRHDSARF